jgi:hypothetical protein
MLKESRCEKRVSELRYLPVDFFVEKRLRFVSKCMMQEWNQVFSGYTKLIRGTTPFHAELADSPAVETTGVFCCR